MKPLIFAFLTLLACCGSPQQRQHARAQDVDDGGSFTAEELPPTIRFYRPPPQPATTGPPLLRWVAPNHHGTRAYDVRPRRFPANVHYVPVRRYRFGAAPTPRMDVSPDGRGVVIAPDRPDDVIVLRDIDDPKSEQVVHLGRPKDPATIWRGYSASDVAWCGGKDETIYVAAGHAIWALDATSLKTLPGWPIARRGWRATCTKSGAVAISEGIYGSKKTGATGSITVFERSGAQRFSTWVSRYPPERVAVTNTGLLVSESERGIVVLEPKRGSILREIRSLGPKQPLRPRFDSFRTRFRGRIAAAPDRPEIITSWEPVAGYEQPMRAEIGAFKFAPFLAMEALAVRDKNLLIDDSIRTESRGYYFTLRLVNAIAYSPDGRTTALVGRNHTSGSWTTGVIWILRDGKLYDTLEGHHGTGTDVRILPDGRIVSLSSAGSADLFIWAPRKPKTALPPAVGK